jgi:superfamily II DNA or RNA helicase
MNTLYNHQKSLLYLNPPRYGLFWETGTGKSRTMVELAKNNVKSLRVICPKALKENWRREIEKWDGGKVFSWEVVSKEEFRRDWNKLAPTEGLIVDEVHLGFGNHKSQMSKALAGYHKKHETMYIWIATATPIMATVWSVFSLAIHLGYKMDWYKFKNRFFYDIRMGARVVPVQRDDIEEDITRLLQQIGGLVRLEECADIPEQTFETEYFKMTRQQQQAWERVDDATFISKWTKRHCIENGMLKGDGYTEDQTFPSDKTDRVIDLSGTNKKLAVICRYNIQIDVLRKALEEEKKKVFVIRGDVKDRDAVVQEANACDDCVILIQADCSAGYELPTFHTIVFASLSFSYVNYKQMIGRFLRINKLSKNHYLHLVVEGGVDEGVYKAIMDKKDFYISVFNG